MKFEYKCVYCGMPSQYHPSDQYPPSDYCHESDHEDSSLDNEVKMYIELIKDET